MGDFFTELKRRHIYRVAAAYAVVAWVLIQLINNIAPMLKLPDWIGPAVLVLLAVGFPIALIFAWILHLASAGGTTSRAATGKLDWLFIGALAAVIALVSYQQLAPFAGTKTAQHANDVPTAAASDGISIAVLPFTNLSGDVAQEFFSDGMTEEITSALAKIPNLRVVARTSAFEFKGQNRDISMIAQALHATHLIEGSVRKDGNEVRITAQLIKADTGTHLWTESYDRELNGVFAVQEEIAQAIAAALRVPLGLKQGENLVSNRTGDTESYQQYLRARSLYRGRAIDEVIAILEPTVIRDPNYAPTWALLAQAYVREPQFNAAVVNGPNDGARLIARAFQDKAEKAAREAIRLDPKYSGGYAAQGMVEEYRGNRWGAAENLFRQALSLDPYDPDTLHAYGQLLGDTALLKDALRVREQLRTLEPFVPVYNFVNAVVILAGGENTAAIQMMETTTSPATAQGYRSQYLAAAYAAEGRYGEAADRLLTIPQQNPFGRRSIEDSVRLLRSAPSKLSAPGPLLVGPLVFVYLHLGAPARVMEYPERLATVGNFIATGLTIYWSPEYAPVRKTERFKAFVRTAGFVDYWRARGWPDLCRPIGTDDFACE